MKNCQQTINFFHNIHPEMKNSILLSIAAHYGIDIEAAEGEVTEPGAENLLDYLTGDVRDMAAVLLND